jgi:hypothetical protein
MIDAAWAITFHSNTRSPRSKRWYRVVRLAFVDGLWFELYWADQELRGNNLAALRKRAAELHHDLLPGIYCAPQGFRLGNEVTRYG